MLLLWASDLFSLLVLSGNMPPTVRIMLQYLGPLLQLLYNRKVFFHIFGTIGKPFFISYASSGHLFICETVLTISSVK